MRLPRLRRQRTPVTAGGRPEQAPLRVAAMTMTCDEGDMLRRWLDYYGCQLGRDSLVVLDDHSTDGSTDGLDCSVVRLPPAPWREGWTQARRVMVNAVSRALLQTYDAVIFTDVDEFLVADPDEYSGLLDYVTRQSRDVLAPVGLNMLHDAREEPPIDPARPILGQRSLVKFVPNMCKPVLKREPWEWSAGTHGIRSEFRVDHGLLLLHLKYYDEGHVRRSADLRTAAFASGRGSPASAWPLGGDELVDRLRSWVDGKPPAELDVSLLDLPVPRHVEKGDFFRVDGNQMQAMEGNDVLRLPRRFVRVAL